MNMVRKFVWLLLTLGCLSSPSDRQPHRARIGNLHGRAAAFVPPAEPFGRQKLKLSAKMPVNLRKNEDGTIEVTVQNPSPFPICLCACRIRLENQLNGKSSL